VATTPTPEFFPTKLFCLEQQLSPATTTMIPTVDFRAQHYLQEIWVNSFNLWNWHWRKNHHFQPEKNK